VSVIASVTLTHGVSLDHLARKTTRGGVNLPPYF
jgi:hypothetical protein